jgi:hypothetical protein
MKRNQSVFTSFCWRFAELFLENRRTSSTLKCFTFYIFLFMGWRGLSSQACMTPKFNDVLLEQKKTETERERDDGANCNILFAFRHGNISILQALLSPEQ